MNTENKLYSNGKNSHAHDTFLILNYTPDLDTRNIRTTIKATPEEEEFVPKACLSLKKTKCLGKYLVRAKLKNSKDPPPSTESVIITTTPNLSGHSAGCAIPGCKCCRVMSRKYRIFSSTNHKSFPIPKYTNCTTNNVIYLLECTKCNKANQYVGQTQRNLSRRLAGHRAASKSRQLCQFTNTSSIHPTTTLKQTLN